MKIVADQSLWLRWCSAAGGEPIDRAIRQIYRELDEDIAARSPTCWLSGKCCHFESYGHRLFVTGLEVAWVAQQFDSSQWDRLAGSELELMDGCPFQSGKLCGIHAVRPLGCRIFYCDPAAQGWQQEVYETYQRAIRALHESHEVEYQYLEWRAALAEARRWIIR